MGFEKVTPPSRIRLEPLGTYGDIWYNCSLITSCPETLGGPRCCQTQAVRNFSGPLSSRCSANNGKARFIQAKLVSTLGRYSTFGLNDDCQSHLEDILQRVLVQTQRPLVDIRHASQP